MDKYAIFTLIWTNVAVPIDAASAALVNALMGRAGPWFKLAAAAWLMTDMMVAAWKHDADAGQRMFRNLLLAGIVYTVAFYGPAMDRYVTSFVHGTVQAINTAIGTIFNKGNPLDSNAFDIIGTRVFAIGLAVFKNLPINPLKSVPLGFAIIIYWFLAGIALIVMFSEYLVSYVLGSFLLGFAPLFIPLYFFPFTRKFFDGWLACLASTMLVQIFSVALAAMFIFVIGLVLNLAATGLDGSQLGQVDGGVVVGEIMMLVDAALFCCIFAVLATALVYIGVRITGGAHAQLGRFQTPGWISGFGGGGSSGGVPNGGNNPGGNPYWGAEGGAGGGAGGVPAGQPLRQYAFQRPVGAAP